MASASEVTSFVHYSRIIDESGDAVQTREGGGGGGLEEEDGEEYDQEEKRRN